MNQSYGNRISKIDEVSWNLMQDKLKNCIIYNERYEELLSEEITDSVLFLDPPYVEREITYNKGFNQELFLNKLKVAIKR
jgi:site-specific DNA-adenine methylase